MRLETIRRLRLIADELRAKADEIDGKKTPPQGSCDHVEGAAGICSAPADSGGNCSGLDGGRLDGFAPKGTPEAIARQLLDDLRKALENPDVRFRIEQIGSPFRPIFAADLARFIEAEQKLWWPIVQEARPK